MFDPDGISAILLAAGNSRRFGSDKLLHPINRQGLALPLAAHSLLPWLENFKCITVVVKPGSEEFCSSIETALGITKSAAIEWHVCQNAALGMAASLGCGIRANSEAAGWMIGLADMPAIPSAAIVGVRKALLRGAGLVAASRNGRRGHPVGFASKYYNELQELSGDVGARGLLDRHIEDLMNFEIESDGIFTDIDIPSDIQNQSFQIQQIVGVTTNNESA